VIGFRSCPPSWETPEVSAVGRLPMSTGSVPYPDEAQARAAKESPWRRSLDGRWRFRLVDRPAAAPDGFELVGHDDTEWDEMEVPGDWAMAGFDAPIYTNVVMPYAGEPPSSPELNPTGLYRTTFGVPVAWKGRRVLLGLGAAESVAHIWINGVEVGFAKDSRLPSSFDVTDHLVRGLNTLAIAVVQFSDASWIEDQDQWWLGGIHRGVTLTAIGRVHLADVVAVGGIASIPSRGVPADERVAGTLHLELEVGFSGAPEPGWRVQAVVEELNGRRVGQLRRTEVPVFSTGDPLSELISAMLFTGSTVTADLVLSDVLTWSAESPVRHRVVVSLVDPSGEVVEARAQLVGFRSVEVADNELRINGAPVLIWGVNHHEHHDRLGRVVPPETLRADLVQMKRHHVNAVRASHYPHQELFYDLCDELGLYVVDEANVESHARQVSLCHDPRYLGAIVERGVRMVRRDRNHPCIVAWSLGNESGYGVAHDAMAAAIRRLDPSRPLHYLPAMEHDLYEALPVTDLVCPMYPEIEAIVGWAESGSELRRPLIMCEFSHAMGNSNGSLADYADAFDRHHGLQGGFIWEWLDHGIASTSDDGRGYWSYGGDFGEADRYLGRHDANFCCDGLVWPDRTPHPAMAEFKALAQPVRVAAAGLDRLRIENRRWFSTLDDLRCRWEVTVDGEPVDSGELDLPTVAPQGSVAVPRPGPRSVVGREATITLRFTPRRRPSWSERGWESAWSQVDVPVRTIRAGASASPRRQRLLQLDADLGLVSGDTPIGWPELSVYGAGTDNDGLRSGWAAGYGARGRWIQWGLDRPVADRVASKVVRRRDGSVVGTRTVIWNTQVADGPILHRQRIEIVEGIATMSEQVDVPTHYEDLARVGVALVLEGGWEGLEWFGLGPHETYPDRRLAALGRWRSTVTDQYVGYIVPQDHGHHHETRWFELSDGRRRLRIEGDRPLGFSALHHSVADLATSRHTIDLPVRSDTFVHLDVAHRGLGTASCGPDTLPRHRVGPGRHRWQWTLAAQ